MEDTVKFKDSTMIYSSHFFLVSNFKDGKNTLLQLDSFVNTFVHSRKEIPPYHEDRIYLYKETNNTNLESIKANPREIDRYSNQHDLVYKYIYTNGIFLERVKIRNGEELSKYNPTPKFKVKMILSDSL